MEILIHSSYVISPNVTNYVPHYQQFSDVFSSGYRACLHVKGAGAEGTDPAAAVRGVGQAVAARQRCRSSWRGASFPRPRPHMAEVGTSQRMCGVGRQMAGKIGKVSPFASVRGGGRMAAGGVRRWPGHGHKYVAEVGTVRYKLLWLWPYTPYTVVVGPAQRRCRGQTSAVEVR